MSVGAVQAASVGWFRFFVAMHLATAGMHSHLGRCFTYNFSADGYTRGEAFQPKRDSQRG